MEQKKYFVGLDMGTSSVGWAVTDSSYHLLRAKGKDMWGVRLFAEAETSADRRSHRTTRRNLNRKKVREGMLREIFEEEICKIDPGFYQRLKESKYLLEDRDTDCPYTLFADADYTDADYFRDYPTIYHLIMELINNKQEHDVRLVFLACLNIFKHRGHFLNDNLQGDGIEDIGLLCSRFMNAIKMCVDESDDISINFQYTAEEMAEVMKEVLPDKKSTKSRKKALIAEKLRLAAKTDKALIEMMGALCGLKVSVATMFPQNEYDEEQQKLKFSFTDADFDESVQKVEAMLSKEEFELFGILRNIHDWGAVSAIMQGCKYLSEARINSYEKHKNDLENLKRIYREYKNVLKPKAYDHMFRIMEENNYCAYVGKTSYEKKGKVSQKEVGKTRKVRRGAKCNQEEFYKRIKQDLQNVPDEVTHGIFEEMANGSFLPKQLTNANGTIPYQLHQKELEAILNNASEYLPFLLQKDETGLSNVKKIVSLFNFRIPYYVGPLYNNNGKGGNAWVVRKEEGKVYPWNFEDKINVVESSEKFIERMVRHCTYLNNEICLPKESLLYERFRVLNELNNLRINGERVSTELKQIIYTDLFAKSGKRITGAKLKQFLVNNGYTDRNVVLTGFDGNFANALLSYGKFCEVFNTDCLTDKQKKAAEEIIYWSTIYGDSKKFLAEKIEQNYGSKSEKSLLDEQQLKRVKGLKFKDWGRFSKSFLLLEGADRETGEVKTIIQRMWDDSLNLQELLSKEYTYADEIAKKSRGMEKDLQEVEFEDLDGLYLSAPVKRMAWQTILILKEIYEIMGYAPSKIFVEMARDSEEKVDGKGERKNSRKTRLLELYKNCKKESLELWESLNKQDEPKLRSKKLYLYYMQKGRCMYSGEPIDLEQLFTNNYDIDHIYPQSVVKDDSLDNNMVLVKRDYNNKKSDTYPIFQDWQVKNGSYWRILKEQNFINEEKYKRLTRRDEFTENELADFVNRQLVETRQGTKVIADILKQTAGETCSVVYAKAGNVSEFRHKFSQKYDKEKEKSVIIAPELVKCRLVNDFHHAYDAYLNIVVGNVYDVKFTRNSLNYIKEYLKAKSQKDDKLTEKYHMNRIFDFRVERNGEVAWQKNGEDSSLEIVKKTLRKNSPIVTRMNYEEKGQLADQTIYSAKEAASKNGVGYVQIKTTNPKLDVKKYGGYKKYTGAYFFLVEHTEKGKRVRTLEAMPLYLKERLNTKEKMEAWCKDKKNGLGLTDPDVRLAKIKMYSKLRIDGFDLYLTGRSGNNLFTCNATQLKISKDWAYYIKLLSQYKEKNSQEITADRNVELFDLLLDYNLKGVYSKRQNPIGKKMDSGREKYIELSVEKQVETLLGIIRIFGLENQGADLRNIGGEEKNGTMKPHKRISDKKSVILINQSVTGFFQNEIDLLKV